MIQPTTRFAKPQAQLKYVKEALAADVDDPVLPPSGIDDYATGYDSEVCNDTITPDCIRGIYNMGDFTADSNHPTKLGISGFTDQVPHFDDLAFFLQHFSPSQKNNQFSIVSVNSGSTDQHSNWTVEANLDVRDACHAFVWSSR
jgi:tripeptidyl-peptidase-1